MKLEITEFQQSIADEVFTLNVTVLEPREKHPTIFNHFDKLNQGDRFRIFNDHDPKPLYYQLIAERGNQFSWTYIQQGPALWIVEIRKNQKGETIGEVAAKDIRKAEVFKKYGIDFCCGGNKSLKQVCEEKGLDQKKIENELETTTFQNSGSVNAYDRWELDFLANYIYQQHHLYYYDHAPMISDLLDKIISHHRDKYPELLSVRKEFGILQSELSSHFAKEERVVFPFIRAIAEAKRNKLDTLPGQPSVEEPIHMMQAEHEIAGEILSRIRKLTNDYTAPADACNSFKMLYKKLQDLENDLIQHIHLENNILFPKAVLLDKEFVKPNSCQINQMR